MVWYGPGPELDNYYSLTNNFSEARNKEITSLIPLETAETAETASSGNV